jgi:hypothetical protein
MGLEEIHFMLSNFRIRVQQMGNEDPFADIDFDSDDFEFEVDDDQIIKADEDFLKSIEEKKQEQKEDDSVDTYNFWVLCVFLIFIVFALSIGAFLIVRGYNRSSQRVANSVYT